MMFFKKKPYDHPRSLEGEILYEKQGRGGVVPFSEFEKISGALFIQDLDFADWSTFFAIQSKTEKLNNKGKLSREQIWLGKYFQKEISSRYTPPVSIRWIDDVIGWGVFSEMKFNKMDYIAEYTGLVRRRQRSDHMNGYCFEYMYAPGISSPYTIDAQDQGGIARYINHSEKPNLDGSIVTCNGLSRVVLFARRSIAKDEQLSYDYGPAYWSKREKPRLL